MQTNKQIYWIAQLFGWTGYYVLIYLAAYISKPEEVSSSLIAQLFYMTFASIAITHLMRWYMIKKNWLNYRLVQLTPRIVFISIIVSTIIHTLASSYEYFITHSTNYLSLGKIIVSILAWSLIVVTWNGIYFTFHFFQRMRQQEMDNVVLEMSKNEIELKNLRSQLNPHFLFNSLNSIRALIDIEPKEAKHALTTLSSLLRKSLLSGKENLIPFSEEMEIVANYLELEKIRFEERLSIQLELDERFHSFQIPPFMIQTLVENAIKHGISKQINGGYVHIKSYLLHNNLYIEVKNNGQLSHSKDTGIGIENTQRRLALQFKNKAHFSLIEQEEYVLAQLKFEL